MKRSLKKVLDRVAPLPPKEIETPAKKSQNTTLSDYKAFFKSTGRAILVSVPIIVTLTFIAAGVVVILTGKFNVQVPEQLGQIANIIAGSTAVVMGAYAFHKVVRWQAKEK